MVRPQQDFTGFTPGNHPRSIEADRPQIPPIFTRFRHRLLKGRLQRQTIGHPNHNPGRKALLNNILANPRTTHPRKAVSIVPRRHRRITHPPNALKAFTPRGSPRRKIALLVQGHNADRAATRFRIPTRIRVFSLGLSCFGLSNHPRHRSPEIPLTLLHPLLEPQIRKGVINRQLQLSQQLSRPMVRKNPIVLVLQLQRQINRVLHPRHINDPTKALPLAIHQSRTHANLAIRLQN